MQAVVKLNGNPETWGYADPPYFRQNFLAEIQRGPTTIGIAANEAFQHYADGIYDGADCHVLGKDYFSNGQYSNHVVLVVAVQEVGNDSYIFTAKNSWGASWGNNG